MLPQRESQRSFFCAWHWGSCYTHVQARSHARAARGNLPLSQYDGETLLLPQFIYNLSLQLHYHHCEQVDWPVPGVHLAEHQDKLKSLIKVREDAHVCFPLERETAPEGSQQVPTTQFLCIMPLEISR